MRPVRPEGVLYATGEEKAIPSTSRKCEAAELKRKGRPAENVSGSDKKGRCCKDLYQIGTRNARSMNQGKLDVVKQEVERH